MKTKATYWILVLTAMTLSGCAGDDITAEQPVTEQGNVITLGVQEVASPVSRAAQQPGTMTFETLKTTGFGVYGYKGEYNSGSSVPTLFGAANTKVSFDPNGTSPTTLLAIPGSWSYGTLKEWEKNGDADEKYTFFAYAPYMASNGTAHGITTVKTDDTAGDPTIGYAVAEDPAQSVDLLWGVRTAYTSGETTYGAGLPWIDVTKGQTASSVLFTFYHALCAVGLHAQVMVDQENRLTDFDDKSNLGEIGKADGCKVTLKSITITPNGTPAKGETPAVAPKEFHKRATLNLNNTTAHQPLWTDHAGTIANLAISGDKIDAALLDPETTTALTAEDVNTLMANTDKPGIKESANSQTIIKNDDLFMLIPQEKQDYKVNIDYFLTYKTASGYHREALEGTATITDLELAAGVKYYLNLVFGLTTFKLSVTATDWDESTTPVTIATELGTSAGHSLAKGERYSGNE